MKVALVHDYLNEFGGAERVLMALSEIWPNAPIYTAFVKEGSLAHQRFNDKEIITSWAQRIPGFTTKLHSPLRFLAPLIWESFNFDEFDVVITSASWYITKGIVTRPETVHVCYCHTPPRYLYGYPTSVEWQKHWLIRQYAKVINPPLRQYDYLASQRVDFFIANSRNVQNRIKKFYRRDSEVIYPPVELVDVVLQSKKTYKKKDYFLVISRIVGGKGIDLAVKAANKLRVPLKVVGAPAGWSQQLEELQETAGGTVEFIGHVSDEELIKLYSEAKAFLALAENEDFGITPVEAMACGTPVLAYRGGGFKETVIEGKTGMFIDELTPEAVCEGMSKIQDSRCKIQELQSHAKQFSKDRFNKEIIQFVKHAVTEK